jgi:8-oxo-dGTP pyrophosphatase MutT (NUDIX family)
MENPMLAEELNRYAGDVPCVDGTTRPQYQQRLREGALTRVENPLSHFCVYFLPYNPKTKRALIIHHKKSGLWLSPGGHIEPGEGLTAALNREIEEELGVHTFYRESAIPFLLTITSPIKNNKRPCRIHFDLWYVMKTDGSNFRLDPGEFLDSRWMTIEEAQNVVTDRNNLDAFRVIEKN